MVRELERAGVRALAFEADHGDAEALIRAVVDRFGRVDIVSTTPLAPAAAARDQLEVEPARFVTS